ncbi:MAG: glycosyltransferase [Burkholderiaceae bacterium]|nr:glycosyltransferase [Burkholderiaceae bacterium]
MIEIVSATRLGPDAFWRESPLGQSLLRMNKDKRIKAWIAFENTTGLSTLYNLRLNAAEGAEVLLFVHDDVWIDDFFIADHALEASKRYDLFGVVGNRRCAPLQPSWAFTDTAGTWDEATHLHGAIAYGQGPGSQLDVFGTSPADCQILDGVLLGVKKSALNARGVAFDEQFQFHFYDVDLCATARHNGLRIGVWPIAITHQSEGGFNADWRTSYQRFCAKWHTLASHSGLATASPEKPLAVPSPLAMKQTPAHELINPELLALVPASTRRVVDVGCMHGQMALALKERLPSVHYTGIDIDPNYAAIAATRCDRAFAADIDQLDEAGMFKKCSCTSISLHLTLSTSIKMLVI